MVAIQVVMSSADDQAHAVVLDAEQQEQPSTTAAPTSKPTAVPPSKSTAAALPKQSKTEALQNARDKMLGIYYMCESPSQPHCCS